ncbi:MAG: BNR/Asp-box repeat protein [Ignavibacteria bacterium]|nr:BNR/Asp-box repeat protein [Ignavibacteria bacterium]
MKKLLLLLFFFIFPCISLFADEQYNLQPTNGPYGGFISSFCYDSSNKNLFANSEHIYKLNRATNKWERQFEGLDSNKYYSYTLVYTDSIYLMNYVEGSSDMVWGEGFLRSSDKGKSWNKDTNLIVSLYNVLKLNNYLFAACGGPYGLYRSADKGLTWTRSLNGMDSLTLGSGSFDQVETIKTTNKDFLFLRDYSNGIFRSDDYGESWQKVSGALPTSKNSTLTNYTAMTTTPDNKIFVSSDAGIFRSTNFGDTWQKMIDGLAEFYSFDMDYLKSDANGNVFASAYGIGIIRLKQNDTTWQFINNGLVQISTWDIFFDESLGIFSATYGGVYKSTNFGDNWVYFNDGINQPLRIKCLAVSKNGLFAGTEQNGIYYTSDKGNSWKPVNNGIYESEIVILKIDSKGNIYAKSKSGIIFKSSDNGSSWEKINLGVPETDSGIGELTINSRDEIILSYYSTKSRSGSLILSKDGGKNWEHINFPYKRISILTYDKKDNLFVMADSTIYRSSNNGLSWLAVHKFDHFFYVNCFYVTNNNSIFLLNRNYEIFRSIDNGYSWINLTQGLQKSSKITCITSLDMDKRLICGDYIEGFYISNDNGDSWNHYNDNLPYYDAFPTPEKFRDFAYDGNGTIYAATYNGVYKMANILSVQPSYNENPILEISPNPATDFIEISLTGNWGLGSGVWELGTGKFLKPHTQNPDPRYIRIYNTMGEIVMNVKVQQIETHRIDVSSLPSGLYFVRFGGYVCKFVKL